MKSFCSEVIFNKLKLGMGAAFIDKLKRSIEKLQLLKAGKSDSLEGRLAKITPSAAIPADSAEIGVSRINERLDMITKLHDGLLKTQAVCEDILPNVVHH